MFRSTSLHALCHLLCLDLHPYMLICLDLHVFMIYAMLSMLRSFLSFVFDVRSTCFHVSYHVFVPRSIFPICCLAKSTCFYARLMFICLSYMFYALCHVQILLSYVLMFQSTCSHARSTCLFACSMLLCLCRCLHMFVCLDSCSSILLCLHPHAQMYIHMPTCIFPCLYVQIGVITCLDRCSLHALCYLPYACALYAMFVCLDLGYFCHAMCYCSPFVTFVSLSCVLLYQFGSNLDPMVFVIIHVPWPISTGFGSPLFACLCLFAYLLVCLSHLFACFLVSLLSCLSCLSALCLFHMLFASFSFHCFSIGFLSLSLHVYTWNEDAWRQGMVSQA